MCTYKGIMRLSCSLSLLGIPSFPELYSMLRPFGLSMSAVMSVHAAVKMQKEVG